MLLIYDLYFKYIITLLQIYIYYCIMVDIETNLFIYGCSFENRTFTFLLCFCSVYVFCCFTLFLKGILFNQVVWAPVTRSLFQRRIRRIPGSIPRVNNTWPVHIPLRTSRISRSSLVGRKPMRKKKKNPF
jgi:hypothetical protein